MQKRIIRFFATTLLCANMQYICINETKSRPTTYKLIFQGWNLVIFAYIQHDAPKGHLKPSLHWKPFTCPMIETHQHVPKLHFQWTLIVLLIYFNHLIITTFFHFIQTIHQTFLLPHKNFCHSSFHLQEHFTQL